MKVQAISSNDDINKLAPGAPRQSVGRGLYLRPAKHAGASHGWRIDYTFNGCRKTLSLGTYPAVTFEAAQDAAGVLRQQLAAGQDPSKLRRLAKTKKRMAARSAKSCHGMAGSSGNAPVPGSFEDVALRWYDSKKSSWTEGYGEKVMGRLRRHLLPRFGHRQIGDLAPGELLELCENIQATGDVETGRRVCKIASAVFSRAVVEGLAQCDFSMEVFKALEKPQRRNFAAILDPKELGALLRAIDSYGGTFVVTCALRLAPLVMLRPGELRQAKWSEIDLDNGLWLIPSKRMKRTLAEKENGEDHFVPLSRQAVAILESLFPLTGHDELVFPSSRGGGRSMSGNTLNAALRTLGYDTQKQMTAHGFRATARTLLVERLKWSPQYAEMQLAHSVPDANGTAYNRVEFEEERQQMLQAWADYLDELRSDNVTSGESLRDRFKPVTHRRASHFAGHAGAAA